jgi:DNA-binding CsgD family transcriptional regulator
MKLKEEITEHKKTGLALKKRERELEEKSHYLEEANTALKVLLKHREEDKSELQENILSNVRELILPYFEKLKVSRASAEQDAYISVIETNLNNIVSPFLRNVTLNHYKLTPKEIQVAHLVKEGKTTKDIAELLHISTRAVEFHRDNIRNKLGLKNKKSNLRSTLLSLQ